MAPRCLTTYFLEQIYGPSFPLVDWKHILFVVWMVCLFILFILVDLIVWGVSHQNPLLYQYALDTFVTDHGLISRVLGDSLIYGMLNHLLIRFDRIMLSISYTVLSMDVGTGPFYNGPSDGGVINPTNLPALMQCDVNFPWYVSFSQYFIMWIVYKNPQIN